MYQEESHCSGQEAHGRPFGPHLYAQSPEILAHHLAQDDGADPHGSLCHGKVGIVEHTHYEQQYQCELQHIECLAVALVHLRVLSAEISLTQWGCLSVGFGEFLPVLVRERPSASRSPELVEAQLEIVQ